MRILFIKQWFEPEPSLRGLAFAKQLVKLGHEVQVLTGFPNYPGGRLYDGYRVKLLQRETVDGVRVIRVPLYPSHDRSCIRRIANYASYALAAALIGPWVTKKPDVAYVYQPPPTTGLPASVFRILRGVPFVYDIQDMWPDTLQATDMFNSPLGIKLIGMWCKLVYRCASKIVVLSQGFKRTLCDRGVPADKIEVIYNWCNEAMVHPVARDPALAKELGLDGRFNVMFAGNMGRAQGLEAVLDAAEIVKTRCPKVQFVFIGGGVEEDRLKQRAKELHLNNVLFLERRPMSEISAILSLADVLLVHLRDEPLFRITIPGKTQTYLSVGRPILIGVRGDAAELVLKAKAGLQCEPEDAQSIAEAVEKFQAMPEAELEQMGNRGKKFYREELSLAVGAKQLEKLFEAVAKRPWE
jgi:glycosyltransferase involved in cell wall biosynthesis